MRPFPVDFDKQMPEWVEQLGIQSKEKNGETLDYLIFQCKRCPDGHRDACMHVPINAGEALNSKVLKDRVQRYVCNDHISRHDLRKQVHAAPLPEQPPARDTTGSPAPAPAPVGLPALGPTGPPAPAPCEMCTILQQRLDEMRHDYHLLRGRFDELLGQDEEIERRLKALESLPAPMPPPHAH